MARKDKSRNNSNKGSNRNRSSGPARRDEPRFEFKDRTGKVHGRGAAQKRDAAPEQASPRFSRFADDKRPSQDKRSFRDDRRPSRDERRPSRDERRPSRDFRESKRDERPGRRAAKHISRDVTRLKATVDKNHKGFAFLLFENREYEDSFVPPREAQQLFHGDRVEVSISPRGHVEGIQVLEHRFRELVGRYSPHPAGAHMGGWVVYERKRAREEIYIPEPGPEPKAGDWLRVQLEFHEQGQFAVTGVISKVYGQELPPSADIEMVAAEFNLVEEHSKESEEEARSKTLEVPGRDLEGREDLRTVPFITIDSETARDFDDAIYVERDKGGFILWVAIADVSHYVTDGSELDRGARSRGTSVYFPERAFHMLPRALSENLCSLKPHEPRLTMVAKMFYDHQGNRKSTELYEAVIHSHRRATYNQIQAEWEQNGKNPDWEYAPHFELYQEIRKKRAARGSIDFDLPEAEMKVEPTGEVISIRQRARLDAHRLIEEFMIAANEAVTEWMMNLGWPFVYRVHEEPAMQSLERFQELAATAGIAFSLEGSASDYPKIMADVVRRLEGHPAQDMLNMALLRSMKQAVYSSVHSMHFGLASPGYTHFTSPIRRYPDLVVHRLLRWALRVNRKLLPPLKPKERENLEQDLVDITEHCSYRERLASDAERESIKLKQVRAMTKHVGDEFDGKIVGMMEAGLFVQLNDPYCEGLVTADSMTDDFYQFDEDRMMFVGKRKKRMFKTGDIIRIRVLRADIDTRKIDFGMTEFESVEAPGSKRDKVRPRDEESEAKGRGPKHKRGRGRDQDRDRKPGKKRRVDRKGRS
ncbi:MAG: ribonuclease R [Bdellovibrionia bacterium]